MIFSHDSELACKCLLLEMLFTQLYCCRNCKIFIRYSNIDYYNDIRFKFLKILTRQYKINLMKSLIANKTFYYMLLVQCVLHYNYDIKDMCNAFYSSVILASSASASVT